MKFTELCKTIDKFAIKYDFQTASDALENKIFSLSKNDFIPLVTKIATVQESIDHNTTEEKLYAKVSDSE